MKNCHTAHPILAGCNTPTSFPKTIIKSMYHGDVLPIVVFSVIFGIALAMLNETKRRPLVNFSEKFGGDNV